MVSGNVFLTWSLFVLVAGLSFVAGKYEKTKCRISSLDPVCPQNTHCLERDGPDGECNCGPGFIFNALYTNDQDYCLVNDTSIQPAAISGPTTSSEPPHHHIVGGILIPLVLVATFVGGAFVIVRYRVLQRVRDRVLGRRRRHRPTYHMGTEFDPPLI